MADAPISSARDVSVVHGSGHAATHALRNVTIEVGEGERVAIVGASGSGKTTLLQVLGGIVAPTSGRVCWMGMPLSTLDAQARGGVRASGIAYVFQGSHLFPTLTAFENVAFAARAAENAPAARAGGPPDRAVMPYGPLELLTLVGLEQRIDRLPAELSGGEQQRVAIARALAQRPRMLLCDEPTGHLDTDTGRRLLDMLDALRDRLDFALVVATHDDDLARQMSRRLTLLDGQVSTELVS